ncbi:hypothetical protein L4C34_07485 [Vibrio profundum]|uniref:DUF7832 domain-containing protein n=1 Tax=Vibrio profundum TaxID=2910247 RepID=UPI003D145545
MNQLVVYDKAKYHSDTVEEYGLPLEQAYVHTAIYLGWVIENDLCSSEFRSQTKELIEQYLSRKCTALNIYEYWDGCFVEDMLCEIGNAFTQKYFDFETGNYINDYCNTLAGCEDSVFHVEYTWSVQDQISDIISDRFKEWERKQNKRLWLF